MIGKTIGWVIIVVALSVPAFLFWNWLGKMKAQSQSVESTKKASEGASFGAVASPSRLSTGTAASAAPPAAVSASTSSPAAPQTTQTAGAKAHDPAAQSRNRAANPSPSAPVQAPQNSGPGTAASPAQGAAPQPPATARQAGETAIEYNPSMRDPTISPTDIKRKLEEEVKQETIRQEQRAELADIRRQKPLKKAEPSCEEHIQLYGIISMPSGNAAMVNDSTVHEGDTVQGAVVKKITTGTVVFNCRGKTFIKKVSK